MASSEIEIIESSIHFKSAFENVTPEEDVEIESDPVSQLVNGKEIKWSLMLCSRKSSKDIGIYLNLKSAGVEVNANVELTIIDGDLDRYNLKKFQNVFDKGNSFFGDANFIERERLFNKRNLLVPSDILTISCVIKILNGPQHRSDPSNHKLTTDLGELLTNGKFSDVTFLVGKKKTAYKAHKAILSARSSVFAAMFDSDMLENVKNEVTIEDLEFDVFYNMLEFIYSSDDSVLDGGLVLELFDAADRYAIHDLKLKCEGRLYENMSLDTAIETLIAAELHCSKGLKEHSINFIKKNFKEIIVQPQWAKFTNEYPGVFNEILVAIAEFISEFKY